MVNGLCSFCGRDLPEGAHHRRRYCADRDCFEQHRRKTTNARRRAARAKPPERGARRVSFGNRMMFDPDHPLARRNGWLSVRRAVLFDELGGANPLCDVCDQPLDWRAGRGSPTRVCVTSAPDDPDDLSALCTACATDLTAVGGFLGRYLPPTSWASVGGLECGAPAQTGAPHNGAPAAAHIGGLPAATRRLLAVWDGTVEGAQALSAAGRLLALSARRGSA